MAFRYIHKSWKLFWKIIFGIFIFLMILFGGAFIFLQLDATEDIVTQKIENTFAKQFQGELIIGELEGTLPFSIVLNEVRLVADTDSTRADTVAFVEQIEVGINLRKLLQNKLVINEFSLEKPKVRFLSHRHGSYTISQALQPEAPKDTTESSGGFIKDISIIVPKLTISDGSLFVETFYGDSSGVNIPEPLTVHSLEAQIFAELTSERRFLDIENFSAVIEGYRTKELTLSGQVYNDDQVLEFNAFNLSIGKSELRLNGAIKGVDLYAGNLTEQFKKAEYNIDIGSNQLVLAEFNKLLTSLPNVKKSLEFQLNIKGTLNSLKLQTFKFGIDESYFSIQGEMKDLINQQELNYTFRIDTLEVHRSDIKRLMGQADTPLFKVLSNLNIAGYAKGTSSKLSLNIAGISTIGQFSFMGQTQLVEPYEFIGRLTAKGVDISSFIASVDTTHLNFTAGIKGKNVALKEGRLYFKGDIYNSLFAHIPIDTLQLTATLNEGILDASYFYTQQNERIEGEVTADFNGSQAQLTLKGQTKNLDLATLLKEAPVDSTEINTSYYVKLKGLKANNISGLVRFRVEPSVVAGDSVKAHQIEVKLSPETKDIRKLVVNSSLFDLRVRGDVMPTAISNNYTYWSNYFERHITKEILLDSVKVANSTKFTSLQAVQMKGKIDFKQLDIVRTYFPSFPSITTDGIIKFRVGATPDSLQFFVQAQSDTLIINQTKLKDTDIQIRGRFHHDKLFKQFANLELKANAQQLKTDIFDMDSLSMSFRLHEDSLFLAQHVKQFSDSSSYHMKLYGALTDTTVTTVIQNFYLGNYFYAWTASKTPTATYTHSGKFIFNSFRFHNKKSYLALKGILSPDASDTLRLKLRDVNLNRVSNLLKEGLTFGGNLDATLMIRSIKNPFIQGGLVVNRLSVKGDFLGQLLLESYYNHTKDRLGLKLTVDTFPISYKNFSALNIETKNVVVQGFYNPNASVAKSDSLFHFKADFNALNPWVLSFLLDDIFVKADGTVTGKGQITKSGDDLTYHADLQMHDLYVKPVFINTKWYLNGEVRLDNQKGVIINYVDIRDKNGGSGVLYGTVDLKGQNYDEYIDLKLRLDKLKFLDNNYEIDIPFYGSVAGTGVIQLVGPTDDLNLYTTEDIIVTRNSNFGLPLIAQTQVAEASEFIEFVESFENPEQALHQKASAAADSVEVGPLEENVEKLSFTDRVNIDLQFGAPQPISVTLLFAPTTGEKMTVTGTGNLRIIMQEGDVQLFGRFDVTGGTYNFVINKLFKRKIDIRSGGTIVWSGDPANARINVEAVYHARPDVSPILPGYGQDDFSRSVPVNLIIEITGTLNSIQQDFYFKLPDFVASVPRLQFAINRINSNEEVKLLQAASIIASGEFLAIAPDKSGAAAFGQQLTKSSTYVNPIISNQIVSPFLSDQINALLNSEVAEVDINFELDTYNEIDLGIALRLYNDRLILQRQGGLTDEPGQDTFMERLGNLSLVYRITPHLSLRAFHRQVPKIGVFSNAGAVNSQPNVNGIGLKAEVSFNTWEDLWFNFTDLLGISSDTTGNTQPSDSTNIQQKQLEVTDNNNDDG